MRSVVDGGGEQAGGKRATGQQSRVHTLRAKNITCRDGVAWKSFVGYMADPASYKELCLLTSKVLRL